MKYWKEYPYQVVPNATLNVLPLSVPVLFTLKTVTKSNAIHS